MTRLAALAVLFGAAACGRGAGEAPAAPSAGRVELEVAHDWNGPKVEPSDLQQALEDLRVHLSVIADPPKK